MATEQLSELIAKAIASLEKASVDLVDAETAIKEIWKRISAREQAEPGQVMSDTVGTVGTLLLWLEQLKRGMV